MADRDVIQALRAIKALALQHHGDEPPSALLHALLVEIPAECDSAIAALDAADARPADSDIWQHDETGRIVELPAGSPSPGKRYYRVRGMGGRVSVVGKGDEARVVFTPDAPAPADDASGAEAMRDDICKGCSTYEWCSVTGACLADSDPHDEGDWRRVVSTLTALAPLPPTADAVERARREFYEAARAAVRLARAVSDAFDAEVRTGRDHGEADLGARANAARDEKEAAYDALLAAEREAGRDGKGGDRG